MSKKELSEHKKLSKGFLEDIDKQNFELSGLTEVFEKKNPPNELFKKPEICGMIDLNVIINGKQKRYNVVRSYNIDTTIVGTKITCRFKKDVKISNFFVIGSTVIYKDNGFVVYLRRYKDLKLVCFTF